MKESVISRREMILNSTGILAALTVGAGAIASIAGCQTAKEKPAMVTGGVVNIGPASNFPAGSANTSFQGEYGIVVTNDSGTPLAIRPQCTYAPAPLKWDPGTNQFMCNAHGCRFDLLGRVTKGPAKKTLAAVVAQRQGDGTLTVDLTSLNGS